VLAEHGRLALQDLVEDELLLGVPQVPRNPAIAEVRLTLTDPQAEEREEQGAPPARKPFAGLAEQMKKRARDRDKDR
jgi:uncharacterized metal-binding protein YceD (DUF177 family)